MRGSTNLGSAEVNGSGYAGRVGDSARMHRLNSFNSQDRKVSFGNGNR